MPTESFSVGQAATLAEYVELIESIISKWKSWRDTTQPWYRGQSDYSFELTPSLYRKSHDAHLEREMVRDFQLEGGWHLGFTPASYLEWLFVMQHYGAPTRLLDWTESYLTALFFAIESFSPTDASVWIMDPWSLNKWSISQQTVPVIAHPDVSSYALPDRRGIPIRYPSAKQPVAVRPLRATARIIAQRGVFTIHGKLRKPLNNQLESALAYGYEPELRLAKILIPAEAKRSLMRSLHRAGICRSVLFPEPEGLARDLAYRYSNDFFVKDYLPDTHTKNSSKTEQSKRNKNKIV